MASSSKSKPSPPHPSPSQPSAPTRMLSTIRPVRSFDDRDRPSEEISPDALPSHHTPHSSAHPGSINTSTSGSSPVPQQPSRNHFEGISGVRLKHSYSSALLDRSQPALEVPGPLGQRRRSGEMGTGGAETSPRNNNMSPTLPSVELPSQPQSQPPNGLANGLSLSATEAHLSNGWDSTVGKAGLGKTGRVINRLVSDNESLKRDIQIERLRAEEAKQAARLLEDKMDRLVSDYEGRLLEANVTKALLARKERQVESLQGSVELERRRATEAGQRECVWKEEMERARTDAKRQVEEASAHANLMEGRYNAISSHWRDQGEQVDRTLSRMRAEVATLVEERRRDDDRISTLRDLCDQQDGNIRDLRRQKDEIASQFERYKVEQEEALRNIKHDAARREEEQERLLGDAREALDKLRWALNVKNTIEWAE